jgi:hypothetical protein
MVVDDQENSLSVQPVIKLLSEFISLQHATNIEFLKKLNKIEQLIQSNTWSTEQKLDRSEQTLNLIARRIPHQGNRRIKCVFIVSFLQAWNTLAAVYLEMKSSDDFEPIIVSTARKRTKDTGVIWGEDLTHEFLDSQGIPHIRLDTSSDANNSMDILKALEPDIIFRQSPWHDLPPVFNAAEINFSRLCYIPYSFSAVKRLDKDESPEVTSSNRHTDLYYHRLCWRIFCETEMHKKMYVDTSIRAGANVVVTGYPKFDYLLASKEQPPLWPIENKNAIKRCFRVIWAPHHSVSADVMNFGMFVETHREMLAWAQESQHDYEFVLKPHPALVSEVVHNIKAFSQEYMDAYFALWCALPNATLYEGGDYGPLFVGSDVMLTDGVGFLSEYQLFEKPLIFLDNCRHFGFNAVGDIMVQSANKVSGIAAARALCERLKNGEQDPMHQKQKQVLPQIMPYPGQSAERIVQAIREGLIEEGVIL